ncbi:hypothetical protein IACHDJAJ_00098 [Aeromonas phage vB_AdhS_TS3]|nr:hypothetical protein IACHDJAJ_00098 [Aeromonas phage vB_AdhS_TS3]
MKIGIDSIVQIKYLEVTPTPQNPDSMDIGYTYSIIHYGEQDKKFGTNLGDAIVNKLEIILNEGV